MNRFFATLASAALVCMGASAQLVTTTPAIVQEDSPNVVITYHA